MKTPANNQYPIRYSIKVAISSRNLCASQIIILDSHFNPYMVWQAVESIPADAA